MEQVPVPVQPVLDYAPAGNRNGDRPPMAMVVRVCGFVAGVIVPIVCFATSFAKLPLRASWQSGEPRDFALLLLSGHNAWPFFPVLAYSMTCMGVVCAAPRWRVAGRFWVGMGLLAGVWLALQYCVTLGISLGVSFSDAEGLLRVVIAVGVPLAAAVALHVIFRVLPVRWVWAGLAVLGIAGFMAAKIVDPGFELKSVGLAVYFITLVMGPVWCLLAYAAVSLLWLRLRARHADEAVGRGRSGVALFAAWAAAYAAGWAAAVTQAIRAYHALPTTRPTGCYVASAAAGGHGRFVGAGLAGAQIVNDQLRRLKCFEIALAVTSPAAHRGVRWVYDRVGPVLAGVIRRSRWLADGAYLSLKPLEWLAAWALRRALKDFDLLAAGVYRGVEDPHPSPLPEYRARETRAVDAGRDGAAKRD